MPQLIYIILCHKSPLSPSPFPSTPSSPSPPSTTPSSPLRAHSKTILGAYSTLTSANAAVETLFNRFVMQHHEEIEVCGVLCGGEGKFSTATATTGRMVLGWCVHAEVLRDGRGLG
ncbi:hypothetical protein ACLMJK_005059 [Lecanora helva]